MIGAFSWGAFCEALAHWLASVGWGEVPSFGAGTFGARFHGA